MMVEILMDAAIRYNNFGQMMGVDTKGNMIKLMRYMLDNLNE